MNKVARNPEEKLRYDIDTLDVCHTTSSPLGSGPLMNKEGGPEASIPQHMHACTLACD